MTLGLGDFLKHLNEQFARAKAIKTGVWTSQGAQVEVPADASQYAKQVEAKIEEVKQRPPVGHEWIGEPGNRIVSLDRRTRDVYENGISIRSELGEDAEDKITSWLRYYPLGGKLRIDTDGAVLGFKQGIGYLIGWLGEEPGVKKEEARGFYLPYEYEYIPTDILCVDTGERLSKYTNEDIYEILNPLTGRIPQNAILNMTIYGDLVYTNENGEEFYLLNVHKDEWFPNHLMKENENA